MCRIIIRVASISVEGHVSEVFWGKGRSTYQPLNAQRIRRQSKCNLKSPRSEALQIS